MLVGLHDSLHPVPQPELIQHTGNRTPFQILADYYQTRDTRDRQLWHEYTRASRGLAAVRWSRGLGDVLFGPTTQPDRSDAELAANDVYGSAVACFQGQVWRHIRSARLELAVLVAAEIGGLAAITAVLGQTSGPPMYDVNGLC